EMNRLLPPPREFTRVAVISPADAAGLGDFRSEADRLQSYGLCDFHYFHALFQGAGAEDSLVSTIAKLFEQQKSRPLYDALVIIRGGGDKAGIYDVNKVRIARCVCRFPIPVLVGIGHERDTTILDEVANSRFATPSLAISH